MCESPYLMKWKHNRSHCPNLVVNAEHDIGVRAWTKWGYVSVLNNGPRGGHQMPFVVSHHAFFGILKCAAHSKIYERTWESLAHVWSEFNGEYERADFPRLIVRFEGTIFAADLPR